MASKQDLIDIMRACADQEQWRAALKLFELLQKMEQDNKSSVLIEIRSAPP
ncbi:hypothetical protein [Bacillus sp. 3255]|uniref:hypothetical protein n=1 Tax=Bacillus sp. 3255 TaxID=2817904 RepID=UPI00286C0200|nr:hypothetical protein [Bacillus sp. 3255]